MDPDTIGDQGESFAQVLLSQIAYVNPYKKDIGLDFFCELRANTEILYYVQAKASISPNYSRSKQTISSLSISCKTIEEYWLSRNRPVFVFMTDITAQKTYYVLVDHNSYRPSLGQNYYKFSIPLSNELSRDNIGYFVRCVIQNQRILMKEDIEYQIEDHYRRNPELYHDLNKIERYLEVMRGSDQAAQHDVKLHLIQQFENGVRPALKLVEGLKSIFINSKDLNNQRYVLDILLAFHDKSLVPLVIKQIERNMRFYEFKPLGYKSGRATYCDFLFDALVFLKAKESLRDLLRFLQVKDYSINRGAIRACGALELNNSIPNILTFFRSDDEGVRSEAILAISKLDNRRIVSELERILQTSQDKLEISCVIQTLANLNNPSFQENITGLINNPSIEIRKAIAFYLGKVNPFDHFPLLLILLMDNDYEVSNEAGRSIHACLPNISSNNKDLELEKLTLPLLIEAYKNKKIWQVKVLLPFCQGLFSVPTLFDIYFMEENQYLRLDFVSKKGEIANETYVNLKAEMLEVLKQYKIPEIQKDVVEQIVKTKNERFIMIAGEMKLDAAFDPITQIICQEVGDLALLGNSLVCINYVKAREWALKILKDNYEISFPLLSACANILYKTNAEKEGSSFIKEHIKRLMEKINNRLDSRIYEIVRRFRVIDTVPIIIGDLETKFNGLGIVRYRMLETIIDIDPFRGRRILEKILPEVDDGWKYFIIECLGKLNDSITLKVVSEYEDYPSQNISNLVKKILSKQ